MNNEKTHIWHRLEASALLLTIVLVPLILWWTNYTADRQRLKLEYVRLAIGILQPPSKDIPPQKELRKWAVGVLSDASPIPLSKDTQLSLADGSSSLPVLSAKEIDEDAILKRIEERRKLFEADRFPPGTPVPLPTQSP